MVSDQEIASCVETLLRQQSSDPANAGASVSLTGVVQQVEAKLGLDLSHKASFIRDQIDLLLGPPRPTPPQPSATGPPPHFIFQAPHQILFQPVPHMGPGGSAGGGGGNVNVNLPVSSPFAQFGAHQELAFRYAAPVQMAAAGAGGAGVVAVAPPQQYRHGPVSPGSRPIGSALDNKESAPPAAKRRGGPGGLSKICGVSPELQAIVGEPAMPRTQIVKQLWAYIRRNNLQDPNNKRKIICNDELRLVFETDCTDMFKMNKLLAKHILPLDETKDMGPDSKKLKSENAGSASEHGSVKQATVISASEHPAVISAGTQPVVSAGDQPAVISASERHMGDYTREQSVVISASLAVFLGTKEKEMFQTEVLRRVLDYIKDNQLEDPANTTMIRCDSRLQQLFGCESLPTLAIPEMLACHLYEKS